MDNDLSICFDSLRSILIFVCFSYFRHGDRYGLACLARLDPKNEDDGAALSVIDQSERGLKIKSVGLLTSSIRSIQSYRPFLQREAKFVFPFIWIVLNSRLVFLLVRVYLHQSFVDYDRLKELLTVANTSVPFSLVSHVRDWNRLPEQIVIVVFLGLAVL